MSKGGQHERYDFRPSAARPGRWRDQRYLL